MAGGSAPTIGVPAANMTRRSSYNEELLQALHRAEDAATSLRALGPRVQRTDAALARQEAAHRLARMRYEGGLSGYQDVLIVEDALLARSEERRVGKECVSTFSYPLSTNF